MPGGVVSLGTWKAKTVLLPAADPVISRTVMQSCTLRLLSAGSVVQTILQQRWPLGHKLVLFPQPLTLSSPDLLSSPSLPSLLPISLLTPPHPSPHSSPSLSSLLPIPPLTPPHPSPHSSPSLPSLLQSLSSLLLLPPLTPPHPSPYSSPSLAHFTPGSYRAASTVQPTPAMETVAISLAACPRLVPVMVICVPPLEGPALGVNWEWRWRRDAGVIMMAVLTPITYCSPGLF